MSCPPPLGPAAEAAHDALLRRLGPALKHDLVVHLQSLTMMSEVLGASLARLPEGPSSLPGAVIDQAARLHQLARDAIDSCLRVASWLTPPDDDAIDLEGGVVQTLDLLRIPLGFRGFALRAEVRGPDLEVARTGLQTLMAATLLHLSDHHSPPRTVDVQVRSDHERACVTVHLGGAHAAPGAVTTADARADASPVTCTGLAPWACAYRRLEAADVAALAEAAGITLSWQDDTVSLQIPRWVTTPLGLAPR